MATIEEKLKSPNIKVYFYEVLQACGSKKTKAERIDLLRKFRDKTPENAKVVQQFMECLTHPKVKFELPEGVPPLKDTGITDANNAPLQFTKVFAKVPYFVATCQTFIQNQLKRESVFIQFLESMYRPEAELFCMVKDKKIDTKVYRGITEALLREAFMPDAPNPSGN
jgi:hypothetical protein